MDEEEMRLAACLLLNLCRKALEGMRTLGAVGSAEWQVLHADNEKRTDESNRNNKEFIK